MKVFFILVASTVLFASVGKFKNVVGDVEILRNGSNIEAKKNSAVEENDKILVRSNGKAQIMFKDNTIVTLGKNSIIEINKYLINGANSQVKLKINKGSYNVSSGEISKLAQKNFHFQAKTATIGIRGTEFSGELGNEDYVSCTKGKINVKIGNKNYDVNQGERLNYKNNRMIKIQKLKPYEFKHIKLGE